MKSTIKFLTISVIVFVFTSNAFSQVPNYVPTSGLVGYWPFNGNANDESGNGNNGTVNGATLTTDRSGNSNSCFDFNGVNQNIDVINSNSLNPNEISISVWIFPLSDDICIISKNDPTNATAKSFRLSHQDFWQNQHGLSTRYGTGNCNSQNENGFYGNQGSVTNNVWSHIITTVSASGLVKHYLNGTLLETSQSVPMGSCNNSISSMRIGGLYWNGEPNWFLGKIDDIGIWNRVLTPQEITNLYTSTVPVSCLPAYVPTSGLVGYWPFCGNANDESGNGNNGTVNGAMLTNDRNGISNSCYDYNGISNQITIPNSLSLNPSEISINVWIYALSDNLAILEKGNVSNASNHGYAITHNDGWQIQRGLKSSFGDGTCSITNNTVWSDYNIFINNEWVMITVSIDNLGIIKHYKNGNLIYTSSNNSPLNSCNNPASTLRFGGPHWNNDPEWFLGKIDDIGIWNRALTPQEITNLYTSTVPPTAAILSGDATICAGASTNLSVAVTGGTAPYTVTVTDGTNNYSATGASPVSIPVSPTATSTYSIVSVTGGGTGTGNTGTATVTVIDATITASDSVICAGETVTLSVLQGGSSNTACSALPTNLQTGLVGYWPFCGNANDESGNGNNGTVNGATLTTDRFGSANSAYSFDGNDDINVGNSSAFNITTDHSISYWYNQNTIDMGAIFSKNNGGGNQNKYLMGTNQYGTSGDFLHWNSTETLGQWRYSGIPVGNSWNFILWRFTSNNIELYRNGVLFQTYTYDVPIPMNIIADLIFGSSEGSFYFQGKIDDVIFHNRALSSSEIQQLYTQGQTSYSWSNGSTAPTINVSPSTTTTYTCTTTTNGVSCTDSATVIVNNPIINLGSDVTACGTSTTLTAPTGYDSYLWSNGATTNTTTVSANGTYSCTVTQGGCSANDSIDVTLIDATISASDSVICPGETVTLSLNSLSSVRYLKYESYYSSDDGQVNIHEIQAFSNGVNVALNKPGFANSYEYGNWANNGINAIDGNSGSRWSSNRSDPGPDINNPHYIVIDLGSQFILESILLDINGFQQTFSFKVSQDNTNWVEVGSGTSVSGSFSFTSPLTNFNGYLWSTGDTTASITASPTQTTTYYVTQTQNGVSCTDSVTVVVNNPTIDLGNDVSACGASTTLTAPTGFDSYLWSNGATTNTTTVISNGTYTCTVSQGGCSASDSIDVTLIDATISASDSVICAGDSVTLSVPQGGSSNTACAALPTNLQTGLVGYWPFCGNANDESGNGNNGTVNGATLTTDRFGSANSAYSFDGGSAFISLSAAFFNGSTSVSSLSYSTWVNINTLPANGTSFAISNKEGYWRSIGLSINSDGSFSFGGSQPSPQGYFGISSQPNSISSNTWSLLSVTFSNGVLKLYKDGVQVATTTASYSQLNYSYLQLGNSTSTNHFGAAQPVSPGLTSFFNGTIDEFATWNRELTATEIQQLYTLGQSTYLWSTGATTASINVTPTQTTTYTCTVTDANGNACTDSVTVVVNNPTIDLGSDVTVCGTSTTLTAPIGFDSYLWSNGATTNTTTVSANGTYSCTVTQGGCSASDSIDVTLINATITASDSVICVGDSVTLSVPQGGSSNTACAALPSNLQTGLVGYWPFCGNANDESGNGNNGTVNGATLTSDRFGSANSAYSFDGVNDCIDIGNASSLDFGSSQILTVNYWVQATNGTYGTVISRYYQGDANNSSYGLGYGDDNIGVYGNGTVSWMIINSPTGNNWNEITIVLNKSAGTAQIYKNGVFVSSGNVNYNTGISSVITSIGRMYAGSPGATNSNHFNGKIDDIAIYNRALSASEIQQLYTQGQTSYSWSNGATTPTINVSPITNTTYTCTVTTNGVSCTDSVTVVVNNPTIDLGNDVTVCGTSTTLTAPAGFDSYLWSNGSATNTTTVIANGAYSCTVTQGGCSASDSIDVTFIDATITASDSVICAGETVTLSLNSLSSVRYLKYESYYSSDDGQVNIHEIQAFSNGVNVALNKPGFANSYEYGNWANNGINAIDGDSGSRWSSNRNDPGPDINNPHYIVIDLGSQFILESILLDINGFQQTFSFKVSQDNTNWVEVGSGTYVSGSFSFTPPLTNFNGYLWSTGATSASITVSPSQTTTYYVTQTQNGVSCTDSVTVNVNQPTISNTTVAECVSYTWNGNAYTGSGIYTWSGTNANGCDSTATLNLTITPLTTDGSVTTSICAGGSYTWPANGQSYSSAQTDLTYVSGCNTATLNLTITPLTTDGSVTTSICAGGSYTWPANGQSYSSAQSGVTVVTDCNTATLNLTITPATTTGSVDTSICAGDSYTWPANGQTYTTAQSGVTVVTGCNTATLNLTITPSSTNTTPISACDSYTWNGTTYSTSGVYTGTTANCVTESLNLTITPSSTNTTPISACNSYSWNGTTYTASGVYAGTTTNCVTQSLNLTITPSSTNTTPISACGSYTWNGTTYTASGVYTGTTTNCVTESLNLTITPSSTNTTPISACGSYVWNGTTYTASGVYTGTTTNCVTESLNLTITPNSTNTTTAAACNSYTWNGTTYSASGVYSGTTSNCVTQSLNLTITPSSTNTTTITACNSYTWNGTSYTASGVYSGTTSNCVTQSLNLTITPNSTNTTTAIACNFIDWYGTTYTSSGTYTETTTNCVTESLNLTIIPSSTNTTTISSCGTYTWVNNGQTYTTSGVYSGTTANCVTQSLNLTIIPNTSVTTTINAIDTYTWVANGLTYTTSGIYTGPTSANCVTQYLNLTINSSGISEEEMELFSLYPNPVSEILYVNLNGQDKQDYLIIDNFGAVVKRGVLGNLINEISVSQLSAGLYYFKIEGTKPRKFSKID